MRVILADRQSAAMRATELRLVSTFCGRYGDTRQLILDSGAPRTHAMFFKMHLPAEEKRTSLRSSGVLFAHSFARKDPARHGDADQHTQQWASLARTHATFRRGARRGTREKSSSVVNFSTRQ